MPSRIACVTIFLAWAGSAVALFQRDLLPRWSVGPPPDLRQVTEEPEDGPIFWTILAADKSDIPIYRPIGRVESRTTRRQDDSVQWTSEAVFEPSGLVLGGPIARSPRRSDDPRGPAAAPVPMPPVEQVLRVQSQAEIDPSGNLVRFRASLRADGDPEDWLAIDGQVEHNVLQVQVRSPVPLLNARRSFAYQPRGLIDNPLSPMDRIPGLRPGQRRETRMLHPLTGQAQVVRAEVVDDEVIVWGEDPVRARVVLTRVTPLSFRTWVRPDDGLVLRQEVPYPLARLVLERRPPGPESAR